MRPGRGGTAGSGDDQPKDEADARADAFGVLFGHLGIIIGETDQPEGKGDAQHDPDVRVVEPRPEQRGKQQR